jgi:hypothetical protein
VEAPGYILKKTNDISITVCDRLNLNSMFNRLVCYKSNSENFITVSLVFVEKIAFIYFRKIKYLIHIPQNVKLITKFLCNIECIRKCFKSFLKFILKLMNDLYWMIKIKLPIFVVFMTQVK